jgi:hypothetical protein
MTVTDELYLEKNSRLGRTVLSKRQEYAVRHQRHDRRSSNSKDYARNEFEGILSDSLYRGARCGLRQERSLWEVSMASATQMEHRRHGVVSAEAHERGSK